jgi:thiol-disulfide isomerase/thioredoxin
MIYKLAEFPDPRGRVTHVMPYTLSYNEIMIDLKKRFRSKHQSIKFLTDTIISNIEFARIKMIVNDTIIDNNHLEHYKIIAFDKSTLMPSFASEINRTPGELDEELIIEVKFSSFVIKTTPVDKTYDISLIPFPVQKISYYNRNQVVPSLKVSEKAPDWRAVLINGDSITLKELAGKVTLLNFTSVNCGFCLKANEVLNKIDDKYKSSKLKVISVYPIDKLPAINYLIEKSKIRHQVIYNADKMEKDYLINGYPNLFLIGPTGRIEYLSPGFSETLEKDLTKTIDILLN